MLSAVLVGCAWPFGTAATWTEPASYVYVFTSSCGERSLIGSFDVTVEDGAVVAYRPLDEAASAYPGEIEELPTLGQLALRAEDARNDDTAVLKLETDPSDGHPTLIDIDWLPNAIDDEECYRITHFERYPDTPPASGWTEPAAYTFEFESRCGLRPFNGRFEVAVEDGKSVAYRRLDNSEGPSFPDIEMPTLADLLNRVERARADPEAIVNAFEVDPADGHPTLIDIDWIPNAIDDEECYTIESYTPDV